MRGFFFIILVIILLILPASAAVYATDNSFTVNLKYNNGMPSIDEVIMRVVTGKTMTGKMEFEAPPPDPEKELINVIAITKDGETHKHNLQTPPVSNIYVSSPALDRVDISQTTTEPGYPVLELYWDYDKSPSEPWRYYMRVNNVNDGYAILGEFRTKQVWQKPITATRVNEIIGSGTIPTWESVK